MYTLESIYLISLTWTLTNDVFQGKSLQFDQWRIAHLAEFGINNLDAAPPTPAPSRQGQGQERTKERSQRTPRQSCYKILGINTFSKTKNIRYFVFG